MTWQNQTKCADSETLPRDGDDHLVITLITTQFKFSIAWTAYPKSMDPLSITVGILGIVKSLDSVAKGARLVASIKNAPIEIIDLQNEVILSDIVALECFPRPQLESDCSQLRSSILPASSLQ